MDSRSYSLPKYTPTPNVQDVGQPLADFDQTTLQSDRYIPREWGQFSNRGEGDVENIWFGFSIY